MTRVTENYTIVGANQNEHNRNKAFMAWRYPVGNPLGYIWTANDQTFIITLQRLDVPWIPPVQNGS